MRKSLAFLFLSACTARGDSPWTGDVDVSAMLEPIADAGDGIARPQDLAFNPEAPDELWVVNRRDDSVTLVFDASSDARTTQHLVDPYALHFMASVSSVAFGAPGTFGTCQDSRNTYNNTTAPNDFTGPTLWSSDLDVFANSNPDAVAYLTDLYGMPTDLGSHLDMLHESPLCVGIAWEANNVYWVFDGDDGALVRYDFQHDHGVGFDDHSDGVIARYVRGQLARVDGVVGHVAYDGEVGEVLVADSGHGRVVVLDATTGRVGERLPAKEPGTDHHAMEDVSLRELGDGAALGLSQPAGLALIDGAVVVTDAATGVVHVLTRAGAPLAALSTGVDEGCLAGITGATLDDLWLVDACADEVLRLQPE